ncbi:hypothetical protein TNCV_3248531 [Trichonephila clavipes]|nr:hypothetical protein TNCV_3248531 [Trichonephila clavipes]
MYSESVALLSSFGQSKTYCRGQPTCTRCAEVGHESTDCKAREKSECENLMPSFISLNYRGLRTQLDDFKSIISTYQSACVALQETFLKSTMTMQVRGYNCVRRDVLDGDASPTGGVGLFTRVPSISQ